MGKIKNALVKALSNPNLSCSVNVTRQITETTIDETGTPATNANYGLPVVGTTQTIPITILMQDLTSKEKIDVNEGSYKDKGYIQKGVIKFKSLDNVLRGDLINRSNGYIYEVFESIPKYVPDGFGDEEFCYSFGLAYKQEGQD